MQDIYLRAASREAMAEALAFFRDGDGWRVDAGFAIDDDDIRPLVSEAVLSEDGERVITPAVFDDRHHLNLRLIDDALIAHVPHDLIVTPLMPVRVWS